MNTIELIQKYGVEYLGRFYSKYRGVVLNNVDEENLQRLYINIPSIQGGLKVWARAGNQYGGPNFGIKLPTPLVGDVVWVTFEAGNPAKAIWYHHGWALQEIPEELEGNEVIGIVTPRGNKIYLQDSEGILKIWTEKETHIESKEKVYINSPDIILQESEEENFGLPKTNKLVERLNLLEEEFRKIHDAMSQATVSPQDGGTSLKTTFLASWPKPTFKTKNEDIQNEHITQPG